MKCIHLSHSDALILLEIIHDSLSVQDEKEVRGLLVKLRELLPYQAGIAALARLGPKGELGDLTLVNIEYPDEYLAELWSSGLVWQDSILLENFRNYRLQYWEDTFQRRPLSKANKDLVEDYGFHRGASGQGYGYGMRNLKGNRGSFFCFHGLDRDPRTVEALTIVVPHLHEALVRSNEKKQGSVELTPRELDILQWVAKGKTNWEIAKILEISERTVKFHVNNITRKLDVTTRAHAVAIGLENGLIELE